MGITADFPSIAVKTDANMTNCVYIFQ